MKTKYTKEQIQTLKLVGILSACLVILLILFIALMNKFSSPLPASIGAPVGELNIKSGMPLAEAKAQLDKLGINYEVIPTESKIANRVEKIEHDGKIQDGKTTLYVSSTVKLYGNEMDADKVVYLTFDDGPTYSNTFDILDTLDSYGIKATFFVLGNRIEEYADRIKATNERGHLIACHSYSHTLDRTSSNYVYASVNAMINEIDDYENTLKLVLGNEAFNSIAKAFRFPGGSSTNGRISKAEAKEYISAIREKGYKIYDWTSLTGDAEGKSTASEFIAHMSSGLDKAKSNDEPLIILMHDKLTTNEALSQILDYLVGNGYYFDTVDNCPEYVFAEQ